MGNTGKTRYGHGVTDTDSYGTSRLEALYILERTLNMKTIAVKNEVACKINASGKKRVINKEETLLALEKQQKMIKEFQDWVWKDEKRKKRLETIFENKYSCVRRRIFDGSFLTFPDLSPNITLFHIKKCSCKNYFHAEYTSCSRCRKRKNLYNDCFRYGTQKNGTIQKEFVCCSKQHCRSMAKNLY